MPYKDEAWIGIRRKVKEYLDNYRGTDETWGEFLIYLLKFWKKHRKKQKNYAPYIKK